MPRVEPRSRNPDQIYYILQELDSNRVAWDRNILQDLCVISVLRVYYIFRSAFNLDSSSILINSFSTKLNLRLRRRSSFMYKECLFQGVDEDSRLTSCVQLTHGIDRQLGATQLLTLLNRPPQWWGRLRRRRKWGHHHLGSHRPCRRRGHHHQWQRTASG